MRNGIGLSIAALLLLAAPVAAQERARATVRRADEGGWRVSVASGRSLELATVERALRSREQLELTDEQVSQLESMRREALERWITNALETEELQSRMRAGYEDDDAAERLRALGEARRDDAVEMRERVESLLTEDQRAVLDRRSRAVAAPRGVPRRAPEARARIRGQGGELRRVPEARARMRSPRAVPAPDALRSVRPLRSPEALRSPRPPRPPRLQSAPRAPRPVPAPRPPRPPRVRRWM